MSDLCGYVMAPLLERQQIRRVANVCREQLATTRCPGKRGCWPGGSQAARVMRESGLWADLD